MQTPTHTRTKNTPTFRRTAPTPVRTPSRGSNAVDLKKYNSFGWGLGAACFLGVVIMNPMFFFAMLLGAGVAATVAWMAYSRFTDNAARSFQSTLDAGLDSFRSKFFGAGAAGTDPYDPTLCFERPPNVRVAPPANGPSIRTRIFMALPFILPVVPVLLPSVYAMAEYFLGQNVATRIIESLTSLIAGNPYANDHASPATATTDPIRQPSTRTQTAPSRMTTTGANAQPQPAPTTVTPTENPDSDFLTFMRSDRARALVTTAMNSLFGADSNIANMATVGLHGPFAVPEGMCTCTGENACHATPESVREARAAAMANPSPTMTTTTEADTDFRVIARKLQCGETVHLHDGTTIVPGTGQSSGMLTIRTPGAEPAQIPMHLFLGEDVRHLTESIIGTSSRTMRGGATRVPNIAGAIPVPLDTPFENVQNILATGATVALGQAPKTVFLCLDSENSSNYLVSALESPGVILSVAGSNFDPNFSLATPAPVSPSAAVSTSTPTTEVAIESPVPAREPASREAQNPTEAPTIFEDIPAEKVPDGTVEDALD